MVVNHKTGFTNILCIHDRPNFLTFQYFWATWFLCRPFQIVASLWKLFQWVYWGENSMYTWAFASQGSTVHIPHHSMKLVDGKKSVLAHSSHRAYLATGTF